MLRLARPYGPDDPWTLQILRLARKGWKPFNGPESALVPTISLVDATAAVLAAINAPPGIYNIADPISTANRDLNDLLARIAGQRILHPLYPTYSAGDRDVLQRSHRLDVSAFKTVTGWNPRFGPSSLALTPFT